MQLLTACSSSTGGDVQAGGNGAPSTGLDDVKAAAPVSGGEHSASVGMDFGGQPGSDGANGGEGGSGFIQSLIYRDPAGEAMQTNILQVHTVVVGAQTVYVNELTSPDPFTHEYQLPSGACVATNRPLEEVLQGISTYEPPRTTWTDPDANLHNIYEGEIILHFTRTATQQQIEQFIAANGLQVVFSWFEPGEEQGNGNELAWFQMQYPQLVYPNFGSAYDFFSVQPLVSAAEPHIWDAYQSDYANNPSGPAVSPNDPLFSATPATNKQPYTYILGLHSTTRVPFGPEAAHPYGMSYSTQLVAVIDNGVYRAHPDFQTPTIQDPENSLWSSNCKISWMGVDTVHDEYWSEEGRGEPTAWWPQHGGLVTHGTMVAGLVNAGTHNNKGATGLAPGVCILPIRIKVTNVLPWGGTEHSNTSVVKALRALRFKYAHGQWRENVRVVNMSISSDGDFRWWWNQDQKGQIKADLKRNDRLYVASAGNDSAQKRQYPAAHDNVLGVSGLWTDDDGAPNSAWQVTYEGGGSNYFNDIGGGAVTYDVSGIYDTYLDNGGHFHYSPSTPGSTPNPDEWVNLGSQGLYQHMNGTSAAAPQVASLAIRLYTVDPWATWNGAYGTNSVFSRIVTTRRTELDQWGAKQIRGPINFNSALQGWP